MTEQQQATPPPPRFIDLVVGIVRRPRATLERFGELPRRPWRRMALLVLVAVILPIVATYSVTSREFAGAGVAVPMNGPGMTSGAVSAVPMKGGVVGRGPGMEQPVEQIMPASAPSPLLGLALPALGRLGSLVLSWVVWSGVLYIIGTMMGGRNTFGHMLQMVVWTWVPFAIRGILQAGFIWITGEPITYAGLSGLAVNAAPMEGLIATVSTGSLMVQSLLKQVDIYLFWHLALIVVGLMAVARLPRRKAITLALASWVLLTLLGLVPALVQGSIAGMRMG